LSKDFDVVRQYPWLPSFKEAFSHFDKRNQDELILEIFDKFPPEKVNDIVLKFFNSAFENFDFFPEYEEVKNLNFTLEFYFLIKFIIHSIKDKLLINNIAELYSKVIRNELKPHNFWLLSRILDDLDYQYIYNKEPIKFRKIYGQYSISFKEAIFSIQYTDYLKLASNLLDENRKLVNNSLSKGFVFIENKRIIRLIQEFVRSKVFKWPDINKSELKRIQKEVLSNKHYGDLFNKIKDSWSDRKEHFPDFKFDYDNGYNYSKYFPPCILEIQKKALVGQNLIHLERLFLVFFLNAFNFDIENIVNMFSTLPDFNREKTKYQVEFAKKKEYFPHSCSSLKSYNLCMAKKYADKLCKEGYYSKKQEKQKELRNPRDYVNVMIYRNSYKKKSNDEKHE